MRKILAVIVFLALSLFAAGAGRTYYVSGTGDDRPTDGLVYKYPDRLDVIHKDSRREIESQTIEKPLVLKGRGALGKFREKFGFER